MNIFWWKWLRDRHGVTAYMLAKSRNYTGILRLFAKSKLILQVRFFTNWKFEKPVKVHLTSSPQDLNVQLNLLRSTQKWAPSPRRSLRQDRKCWTRWKANFCRTLCQWIFTLHSSITIWPNFFREAGKKDLALHGRTSERTIGNIPKRTQLSSDVDTVLFHWHPFNPVHMTNGPLFKIWCTLDCYIYEGIHDLQRCSEKSLK